MKKTLLASVALVGLIGAAEAAPVVIQDGFVQAGVSDYGTLGSNGNNPPGILYDKTGMGNYGVNDFLTPGDPFEGFYISASTGNWGSNNDGGTSDFGTGHAPMSNSPTSASWMGTSLDGALTVANTYTLTTMAGRSMIAISTTITNNSTSDLSSLEFLRTLDPDPDVNAFGSYFTVNTFLNGDACGTGPDTGQTICIGSDSTVAHTVGISADWSTDPTVYLMGINDGNGDYAIGLAFDIGSLSAGGSTTLDYYYALGADRGTAAGGVPEPMTLGLVAAGLAGIGAFGRRKKKPA